MWAHTPHSNPIPPKHLFFCDDARLDPPHLGFKTRIFFLRLGSASLCLPRGRRRNRRSNIFPPFPKSFFPRPFSELGQARHGWKFVKQILNSISVTEILRSKNQWHFFCEVHWKLVIFVPFLSGEKSCTFFPGGGKGKDETYERPSVFSFALLGVYFTDFSSPSLHPNPLFPPTVSSSFSSSSSSSSSVKCILPPLSSSSSSHACISAKKRKTTQPSFPQRTKERKESLF